MRILLVQRGLIGDMACLTPVIELLKAYLPNCAIGVLGNPYNIQVLSGNPSVDSTFVYKKKPRPNLFERAVNLFNFIKLRKDIKSWKPNQAILACGYYDYHGLSTLRKLGIRSIIGYESIEDKPKPKVSFPSPAFSAQHEVEAISHLLTALGITQKPGPMRVFADPHLVSIIQNSFHIHGQNNIIVHLSGRTADRRWGSTNYEHFLRTLLQSKIEYDDIIVVWAPNNNSSSLAPDGDDHVASNLGKALRSSRVKFIPTSSIAELIATLKFGSVFVGSDGGAMHLACASGLGVVALFDSLPNTLNHWHPWQVPNRVLSREGGEIQHIAPEEVLAATESLLLEKS